MQKPPKCYQNWNTMKKVDGGRLCAQCDKTIVDLRKSSWKEIETLQKSTGYSTCAMYSDKQLKHWGHQPPVIDLPNLRSLKVASLMAFLGLTSPAIEAKEVNAIEQVYADPQIQEPVDTVMKVYRGRVVDSANAEPVAYATIFASDRNFACFTDEDGKFELRIPVEFEADSVEVSVHFVGMKDKSAIIFLEKENLITIVNEGVLITSFAPAPVPRHRKVFISVHKFWYKLTHLRQL